MKVSTLMIATLLAALAGSIQAQTPAAPAAAPDPVVQMRLEKKEIDKTYSDKKKAVNKEREREGQGSWRRRVRQTPGQGAVGGQARCRGQGQGRHQGRLRRQDEAHQERARRGTWPRSTRSTLLPSLERWPRLRRARLFEPGRSAGVDYGPNCGCSSMVERQLPKLHTWVRFPSPAPAFVGPHHAALVVFAALPRGRVMSDKHLRVVWVDRPEASSFQLPDGGPWGPFTAERLVRARCAGFCRRREPCRCRAALPAGRRSGGPDPLGGLVIGMRRSGRAGAGRQPWMRPRSSACSIPACKTWCCRPMRPRCRSACASRPSAGGSSRGAQGLRHRPRHRPAQPPAADRAHEPDPGAARARAQADERAGVSHRRPAGRGGRARPRVGQRAAAQGGGAPARGRALQRRGGLARRRCVCGAAAVDRGARRCAARGREAAALAARAVQGRRQPTVPISAHVGVAQFPQDGKQPDQLLRHASSGARRRGSCRRPPQRHGSQRRLAPPNRG